MSLHASVRANLQRSLNLYTELATELPEDTLARKLPGLPSSTIGQQLWCVVGARESYRRAIQAGKWAGFACSLGAEEILVKSRVLDALRGSGTDLMSALVELESFDDGQNQLVVDLLEHEAQHHGQLIRYLYGMRLPIPAGWTERYGLG